MLQLPPPGALNRVLHTDEFIVRTNAFYHAMTERLITIGNPYYRVKGESEGSVIAEKVSPHQYRVFRIQLPDPNQLALVDASVYDPKSERLVWLLRGFDIGRGGPLGVGATGHPLFDKLKDAENPNNAYTNLEKTDSRQNVCMDPKSMQMIIVGCTPAVGHYWDKADACPSIAPPKPGACPALVLKNSPLEDGDMIDLGFGSMNNKALNESHSAVPLDIVNSITKHPDMLKMAAEPYGNSCWFCLVREQMFARHLWARNGEIGDAVPNAFEHAADSLYLTSSSNGERAHMATPAYLCTPSGSLVSSDTQVFNRPFWLQRAQGRNNGACWHNELFVSIADNTRGTNFNISVKADGKAIDGAYKYKGDDFKQYVRHCEIFELTFIIQLGKVSLTAEAVAHLQGMDASILEEWNIGFQGTATVSAEEKYRYLSSLATKCPDNPPTPKVQDRYDGLSFWTVDVSKTLSKDLENYPLGRKFLYQAGLTNGVPATRKRTSGGPSSKLPTKRKRRKVTRT
ncbi:L1 [Tursiops truncatus papillomavirus 2]|uniref:Major capsid protein L1 n=1 Tax=Tursiops truncatus papillomavirus 2 TaxID=936060 RepID=Q29UC8_9PAPI|nr:L1 [Tursiops truncatus papillomavirus 2]AAX22761.1 major capsid protein [Tursiops truncatus papillomavirus 2]AAY32852.1 L1 [Tursiops truncatus papillomavirus 2]